MKVIFKESFLRSVKRLKDKAVKKAVEQTILDVEKCARITDIKGIKKLKGHKVYYRIRTGDYRIGLKIENQTAWFVVVEHRKDIYKKFP